MESITGLHKRLKIRAQVDLLPALLQSVTHKSQYTVKHDSENKNLNLDLCHYMLFLSTEILFQIITHNKQRQRFLSPFICINLLRRPRIDSQPGGIDSVAL